MRRVPPLTCLAALALLLTACSVPGDDAGADAGTHLTDCGVGLARDDAMVVLSGERFGIGGWSHVNGIGSFENVAQELSAYRITAERFTPDESCGGERTWSVVLAKKTWDWDRNHANGIEAAMPQRGVTFGGITDITLVMRLDTAVTTIPTAEELAAAYGELLTAEELARLDDQRASFEVTLFGSAGESPFVNASVMVHLDPAVHADRWVRVRIPREQIAFYTEADYERSPIAGTEYQDHLVRGIRINPETSSGLVARHFIGDAFDPQQRPELFKEMGVSFALIEVGWEAPASE